MMLRMLCFNVQGNSLHHGKIKSNLYITRRNLSWLHLTWLWFNNKQMMLRRHHHILWKASGIIYLSWLHLTRSLFKNIQKMLRNHHFIIQGKSLQQGESKSNRYITRKASGIYIFTDFAWLDHYSIITKWCNGRTILWFKVPLCIMGKASHSCTSWGKQVRNHIPLRTPPDLVIIQK